MRASGSQTHACARAESQHRDLRYKPCGPMRLLDIKMSARNLCKHLNDSENDLRQKPVRVIENDGEQRHQRRRQKGRLESGAETCVRSPTEEKEGCCGEGVAHKDFSFEKETAKQKRCHYRRPHA